MGHEGETDCSDLPPATTFVGELDPFLDETVAYVERLRAAGVLVELRRYPRCFHGFDAIRPGSKVSREANGLRCRRRPRLREAAVAAQKAGAPRRHRVEGAT